MVNFRFEIQIIGIKKCSFGCMTNSWIAVYQNGEKLDILGFIIFLKVTRYSFRNFRSIIFEFQSLASLHAGLIQNAPKIAKRPRLKLIIIIRWAYYDIIMKCVYMCTYNRLV
jgi:hypothetical protein